MRILIGITGASGSVFAVEFLKRCQAEKYLIISKWGKHVLGEETSLTEHHLQEHVKRSFSNDDLSSAFSSGSNHFDAMVIVPCSASTMAKIASGIGDSLITRCAQVALKEGRKLIIAIRESPLSTIALEQAHKLSQAGAVIMPISPAFYQHPESLEQMVAQFADRILALLGFETQLSWKSRELE